MEIYEIRNYKDCEITLHKLSDEDNWYITVEKGDRGFLYDGWWRDSSNKTTDEAYQEALTGACLN